MADEEEAEAAEEEGGGGGGKKKIILLIVIGLLLVLLSVGGTVAVLTMFKEEPPPEELAEGEEAAEEEEAEEVKLPAIYFPLNPPILLTYPDKGRQRYAQIEITLMARSETVVTEIELHSSRIRNDLILAFSGMEYAEIQTPEGKELMRQQALIVVQDIMTEEIDEPGIEQVLFTNLVMQ